MLNALIDGLIHQTCQLCQTPPACHVYSCLLVPTFPTATSTNLHNVQGLIGAPQSQDAIEGDTTSPQSATSEVSRSIATTPRNITGTTGLLPHFMPPATTLSRVVVGSTPHHSTPSSIDIMTDTVRLTMGSSTSPSLPVQRENGSLPAEPPFPTLLIVNLTDRDTIRSTSSSSTSDATPFQPSRLASDPSPVLVVLENTVDTPSLFEVPHATLASASAPVSSFGPMDDCDGVSELPRHHLLPSVICQQPTLLQRPFIQPRSQEIILPPSSPSRAETPEASYPAQPIQTTSQQTSVRPVNTFPRNRSAEQNTVNTPFSLQVTPVDFPEPSRFVGGSVQTPVQGAISPSPDTHPYPHLTTPSSLRSRRALSLRASPGHVRQNLSLIPMASC
jgi:hypothetical protein